MEPNGAYCTNRTVDPKEQNGHIEQIEHIEQFKHMDQIAHIEQNGTTWNK